MRTTPRMNTFAVLGTLFLFTLANMDGSAPDRPMASSILEPPIQNPTRHPQRAATFANTMMYCNQGPYATLAISAPSIGVRIAVSKGSIPDSDRVIAPSKAITNTMAPTMSFQCFFAG